MLPTLDAIFVPKKHPQIIHKRKWRFEKTNNRYIIFVFDQFYAQNAQIIHYVSPGDGGKKSVKKSDCTIHPQGSE